MVAGRAFRRQVIAQLSHPLPGVLISPVQEVLRPAPGIQRRERISFFFCGKLLRQGQDLVVAALKVGKASEDPAKQLPSVVVRFHVLLIILHDVQRAGQGRSRPEGLRRSQRQLPGAVAAHGKASRQGILSFFRHAREKLPADAGQLLRHIGPVPDAVGGIRIKAKMGGRHHHRDPESADIAFDGGPSLPGGLIVAETVQQIHGLIFSVRGRSLHPDLPACLLGKDHVHFRAHSQYV